MLYLRVCTSCLKDPGAFDQLQGALRASDLASHVALHAMSCGEFCGSPARLWLQQSGGASYVFEGLDLAQDASDILATARTYLSSPKGWIDDARPCGRLRFCLTVRLPA